MIELPRITLITPSYNQAAYLEQTIRSVLGQRYPNLQYGIVDGGSKDGSVDIIKRYAHLCDFVIIEPDQGQSDAINKGLERADGQVMGWLNSDDLLLPGALWKVGRTFAYAPETQWLIGNCIETDADNVALRRIEATGDFTLRGALFRDEPFRVPQPSTFWRRLISDEVGLLDRDLHYCMDFDLWCRFLAAGVEPTLLAEDLSTYRLHDESKTVATASRFGQALIEVQHRYARHLSMVDRIRLWRRLGYQQRLVATRGDAAALRRAVARRPWWLLSSTIRQALQREHHHESERQYRIDQHVGTDLEPVGCDAQRRAA